MPPQGRKAKKRLPAAQRGPTWTEELSTGSGQLLRLIEGLVARGNVRRLVVLRPSGRVLFQSTLTAGLTVVGIFTVLAPVLTALSAIAALFTEVRIKIVYAGQPRNPDRHK